MSRLNDLAAEIAKSTEEVSEYFSTNNLPQPSFEISAPIDAFATAPSDIQNARTKAIEASIELQQLLNGNVNVMIPDTNASSMRAIYRFKIANQFPIGEEISYSELADRCDLYEHDLRRLIRYAIVRYRVFKEARKGYIQHTAASKLLAESTSIQNVMALIFEETWPANAKSGYSLANDTPLSIYSFLASHPDRAKRFSSSMATTSESGMAALAKLYDWSALSPGSTVVDVGGARGHVSAYLAQRFPHLNFVVQDLPAVVAGSEMSGEDDAVYYVPSDVIDRVTLQAHDFFTPQPIIGAAVYLIRYTLHNWSDAYAAKMLRYLVHAMAPRGQIVVQDHMLPEPGTLSLLREREIRGMDLIMLSLFNSREREEADWAGLFDMADERLKLMSAKRLEEGSASAVIVAALEG
ncbi:S-adenosyl-L-methionine-dependent methyltransferase [Rhizodiscina lignyota]|uniref:S-adenosyl-L-methionine-dependent methyltransferase n=1 Tax=Rhizodiscina lignyota TaxID=1504668 RepID=A0A9P4LZU3_9PEZI|nr:S-adenosyl-L-methionine-dependent methyltransferase [Rhizodiscina lignyota]